MSSRRAFTRALVCNNSSFIVKISFFTAVTKIIVFFSLSDFLKENLNIIFFFFFFFFLLFSLFNNSSENMKLELEKES